jgi:hypothetical protein
LAVSELPLVSPNWWTYGKTLRHVRTVVGDKDIADSDLIAAIERGDVCSKLEQAQMQYDPPARRSMLLKPEFYQRDYKWVPYIGQWILQPRNRDQRLLGRLVFYFWGPDLERLWPVEAPTIAASPATAGVSADGKQRQRPGPKRTDDWDVVVAAKLLDIALRKPDDLNNVDELVRYMRETFLPKQIGWAPADKEAVRKKIVSLLQFVRQ